MSWSSSMTLPSTRAWGTTSCIRFRERRKGDLPQPDGPMRAMPCLGSTDMVTSARAWNDPNQALRPSTSMRLAMGGGPISDKPVAAGQKAGDDRQEQHDDDQRKGTGPCTVHSH